jgi:hypothetical protein
MVTAYPIDEFGFSDSAAFANEVQLRHGPVYIEGIGEAEVEIFWDYDRWAFLGFGGEFVPRVDAHVDSVGVPENLQGPRRVEIPTRPARPLRRYAWNRLNAIQRARRQFRQAETAKLAAQHHRLRATGLCVVTVTLSVDGHEVGRASISGVSPEQWWRAVAEYDLVNRAVDNSREGIPC